MGGTLTFWAASAKEECRDEIDGFGNSAKDCYSTVDDNFALASGTLLVSSYVYGIIRAITYDKPKPKNAASSKYDDFNIAVLPDKQGDFMAYLLWSKVF